MQKIDERGKICPFPLFHTKRKLESMKPGEDVEIIIDDPTAKETIPRWSKEHGHEIVSIYDVENHFRIVVRKGDNKK